MTENRVLNVDSRPSSGAETDDHLLAVLGQTLAYARSRDYTGWDYGDGMSSELLRAIPFDNKWVNIAVQETIKRAPINVRSLFLVEQRQNFKGTALFVLANLNAYQLTNEAPYREEARELSDWLVDHQSDRIPEFAGSHSHDLQALDGKVTAGTPGVVGTAYAVQSLLKSNEAFDDCYSDDVHTAENFVFDHLDYEEIDAGARINYKLTDDGSYHTLNANALGARILLELFVDEGNPRLLEAATKILEYVVSEQTDLGGWMYRDPPSASHLSMDNHHNGFIIESLLRYREVTGDNRFEEAIETSLAFYRDILFEEDGAPNWDEESRYPKDIHGAAQGILVFTYAGNLELARRIVDWTLETLYAGNGRVYFRKQRYYTKRITLMRWCQGWLAYALSEYLLAVTGRETTIERATQ